MCGLRIAGWPEPEGVSFHAAASRLSGARAAPRVNRCHPCHPKQVAWRGERWRQVDRNGEPRSVTIRAIPAENAEKAGAPGRIRTCDLRLRRPRRTCEYTQESLGFRVGAIRLAIPSRRDEHVLIGFRLGASRSDIGAMWRNTVSDFRLGRPSNADVAWSSNS